MNSYVSQDAPEWVKRVHALDNDMDDLRLDMAQRATLKQALLKEVKASGLTLQQMGDALGITRQRVSQMLGRTRPTEVNGELVGLVLGKGDETAQDQLDQPGDRGDESTYGGASEHSEDGVQGDASGNRCPGCYVSDFDGKWWCDNCDRWPCIC